MMNAGIAVDVVVDGGPKSEMDVEAIALIANKALKEAGFINTARVYLDGVTGCVERKMELDYATPTIMTQLHERHPEFFQQAVVIAANQDQAFPAERRRYDRAAQQATHLTVVTDDDDPDEIWDNLPDWEKFKILRESALVS